MPMELCIEYIHECHIRSYLRMWVVSQISSPDWTLHIVISGMNCSVRMVVLLFQYHNHVWRPFGTRHLMTLMTDI